MRIFCTLLFLCISTSLFSQSEALAKNYFEQGDFEKALPIYQKLHENNPGRRDVLFSLVATHQQLEQFDAAEALLNKQLERTRNTPTLFIELGRNFSLQDNKEKAEKYYQQALSILDDQPNFAHSTGAAFDKYNLLDHAIAAYEKGMEKNPKLNFNTQLARIYGEQGKLEKMFESYLEIVAKNPNYLPLMQRNFNNFVTEDPENEANVLLRKTLLRKSQNKPDLLYNELLSWLFVQQKEYDKAFAQQRAVYRRTRERLSNLSNLAQIAVENTAYETAKEILEFVIENANSDRQKAEAHQMQMQIEVKTAKPEDYEAVEKKFIDLLSRLDNNTNTLNLELDYNSFLAFQQEKKSEAIENLRQLTNKNLSKYQEAETLMLLADILVFDEKFNEALIYYSRIQNKVKNDPLSQEARFKVARTSYFKGDFKWAQTQLDILKKSTSQLIANDAMELSLLISDNSLEDSTQTALKKYAKADLLALQNKNEEAITLLDGILKEHRGEAIEDEALFKQARVYETLQQYNNAIANYRKIIDQHGEDILADNANFYLAEIYYNTLGEPEKAKPFYEAIIFNHEDSIFFVEARKKYRTIRGDAIN